MSSVEAACDALFIGPHPDDVDLFCGGTVAHLVNLGYRVVIVDLTRGELASVGTPAQRAVEAGQAAAILGVAARTNLGLPDAGLDALQHAPALVTALRTHRPRLVFAPAAADRHPDHEAAHAIVRRAVFLSGLVMFEPERGPRFRPEATISYPMHTHTRPDFCVDIGATFQQKQQAIDCFSSQFRPPAEDGPATLINRPGYRAEVETRDRFYGAQIGVAVAEPFIHDTPLSISDPVALLGGRGPSPWQMTRPA